jgi:hypothetical protein
MWASWHCNAVIPACVRETSHGADIRVTAATDTRVNGIAPASTQGISDRLRAIDNSEFQAKLVPLREALVWMQPVAPISVAQAAPAQAASVGAPPTRDLALLAADVYKDVPNPPAGYHVATAGELGKLGLKPQDMTSTQSAFRARLYVKSAGGESSYVVAFRGSTDGSDWKANFQQGVGLPSDHYARALTIGKALNRHPEANVTITGHSLGGGLASAAAVATGRDATTFNAAGLSDTTIKQANTIRTAAGIGRAAEVAAFYVRGEVLSAIQDGGDRAIGAIFGGVVGAAIADAPSAYGTRHPLDAVRPAGKHWYQDNPGARHGMDWVLSSLGVR